MNDKQFKAIIAKNEIARELGKYYDGEPLSITYVLSCLEDIEAFMGLGNQPSVNDSYINSH